MLSKKTFIKLFSVGMILLRCNTSVVVKKPEFSNFLEIKKENPDLKELFQNLPKINSLLPAQATAVSNSKSRGKALALDNSVAQVINAVNSKQSAEANAKEDSAAVAVSSGNTELNTKAAAEKNSNVIGVGAATTDGKATSNAEGQSLSVAANLNENKNESNLHACDKSNVVSVSASASEADAASNASQNSIADGKSIDKVHSDVNIKAENNSNAASNTSNQSLSTTSANSLNKSVAQTVSESTSGAKTDLAVVNDSKAAGNLEVKSGADSVGKSANGGNALATSQSNTAGDNTGCAKDGSSIILNNKSENQANSESNSLGTVPGATPLQEVPPFLQSSPQSQETPCLQSAPKEKERNDICSDIFGKEETRTLQATPKAEDRHDICSDITTKDEIPTLQTGRRKETALTSGEEEKDYCTGNIRRDQREALRGGRDQQGERMQQTEVEAEGREEQEASCEMRETSGTTLRQGTGQENPDRNACDLRAESGREEIEFECRKAPKRSNRLRNRREERRNRRKALRQQRRRKNLEDENICEARPRLEVTYGNAPERETVCTDNIPKVDLESSANNFIINNANGIKQQSADNLAKIQNLLTKATC